MDAADPPPPTPLPPKPGPWGRWVAQRGAELFVVFVGVYAAFLLNGHQTHRQEQGRRAQLLRWMESVYSEQSKSIKDEAAFVQGQADAFNRHLDAGEMPELHAFEWRSDYDPADITGLLQSGGYDLLDIETVRAIKEADSTLRQMVAVLRHDQQLSDALILPNLGRGQEVFYDPATKRLRETYKWYQQFFKLELDGYAELRGQVDKVIVCIREERRRNG